jgi:Abortive infection alpha
MSLDLKRLTDLAKEHNDIDQQYPWLSGSLKLLAKLTTLFLERVAKKKENVAQAPPEMVNVKVVLQAVFEGAMTKEDDLKEMWASLVANAFSAEKVAEVRPLFVSTLRQMTSDDARVLKIVSQHSPTVSTFDIQWGKATSEERKHLLHTLAYDSIYKDMRVEFYNDESDQTEYERWHDSLQNLKVLGLTKNGPLGELFPTSFGISFLRACEPPKTIQ